MYIHMCVFNLQNICAETAEKLKTATNNKMDVSREFIMTKAAT